MKKLLPLPVLVICMQFLFGSCATLLNGPAQRVLITTDQHITHLSVEKSVLTDSTLQKRDNTRSFIVPRSSQPLVIHYLRDSVEKTLYLKAHWSFAFWFNIYANYGLGMLVDMKNPKSYGYPSWTYLSAKDSGVIRKRFPLPSQGDFRLSLRLAPVDIFSVKSPQGRYNSGGIFGVEAGLDYFYRNTHYLSVTTGAATNAAPVDRFGKGYILTVNAFYVNIRENQVIGPFEFGYGINFSDQQWLRTTLGDTVNKNKTVDNLGFGLSLSAKYRLGKFIWAEALYQPDLMDARLSKFSYQHYISVGLTWKFPFKNK